MLLLIFFIYKKYFLTYNIVINYLIVNIGILSTMIDEGEFKGHVQNLLVHVQCMWPYFIYLLLLLATKLLSTILIQFSVNK